MKPYNIKKYRYKGAFFGLFIFLIVLTMSAFFYYIWVSYYNVMLRNPYIMKGSIFISLIYAFLYIVFTVVFDSAKISDNHLWTTIFLQTLNIFFCNLFAYLIIIIPAYSRGLIQITPLIIISFFQIIVMSIICFIFHILYKKIFPPMPMLLISNDTYIDNLLLKFNLRKDVYNVVDFVSCDKPLDEIKTKCSKYKNIILGDIEAQRRNDILKFCFENVETTYIIPKLSDIIIKDSISLYTFDTPIYVSNNRGIVGYQALVKRFLDICFSLIILIISFPLMIIVSVLIKLEDGGPVLFIQKRITKDNKIFNILKFRSMKVEKDCSEVKPTEKDDDRITKIGKFIRNNHIDELPQLINVLIGDMSIVGPRPERVEHVELYTKEIPEFSYRMKVKSGITGLAQIYGKYNTNAYDKLKLDLIYIKNYSLFLDIELLFKTFKTLFIKDNTEGFDKNTSNYIKKYATKTE